MDNYRHRDEDFYKDLGKRILTKYQIKEYNNESMHLATKFYDRPIDYDIQIDFHTWLRDTPDGYIFLKLGDKN